MNIRPVKYILIAIDAKTFNRIIRFVVRQVGGTSDLQISIGYFLQICTLNDITYEFVRLKHKDYYIDLKLHKVTVKSSYITLHFEKAIDYNHSRYIPKTST